MRQGDCVYLGPFRQRNLRLFAFLSAANGINPKPVVSVSNRRYHAATGNRFRFYFDACRTSWRLDKVVPKLSWRG
jgi:hypothetical protein